MEDLPPTTTAEARKRAAILTAAMQVCATYGFRKTSMADIAQAAGMSRPALYQHFPNKEAIFRAGIDALFQAKIDSLRDGLAQEGPPAEVLPRAVVADMGAMMQNVLNSPHGEELMLASKSVAQDIITRCMAEVTGLIAVYFERHGADDPQGLAETFEAAKMGLSEGVRDYAAYEARVRHLASAFASLLNPR